LYKRACQSIHRTSQSCLGYLPYCGGEDGPDIRKRMSQHEQRK
jgi:hypothetical protein